jgi:hypothetical protein
MRTCACDHGFPLCCCALGLVGEALLNCSRLASAVAGWPGRDLDPEAVEAHYRRMTLAQERRAGKPWVALGVDQHRIPPPGCKTCGS